MTYRELLELYKKNELENGKKAEVEADIEKQEAISDYLYEKAELPELEEFLYIDKELLKEDNQTSSQEREFLRMVKRSIRKAFFKMGIIIGVVVLVIALFIQFALPKVVASFYYNPGKELGENTNQISLDYSVYSELFLPGYLRDNVTVGDKGYGNYDICINQVVSSNKTFTNVAGSIEQGKLNLYDVNALKEPAGNAFAWFQIRGDLSKSLTELVAAGQSSFLCAAGTPKEATASIQELDEKDIYIAYVTLDKMMNYEDFMRFIHEQKDLYGVWCAIRTSIEKETTNEMFHPENIGFICDNTQSTMLQWVKEKYPNLILWESDLDNEEDLKALHQNMQNEAFMKKHFIDMLKYMSDQNEFVSMMGKHKVTFTDATDYVERNGLIVYGFATIADKATLLELNKKKEVYEICTEPLR